MVILEVSGTIDLSQFWPNGESDADTVNVLIGDGAFTFREREGDNPRVTHLFDDAKVQGSQGAKSAIRVNNRLNQRHVTVRLQGIDAPELHYQPAPISKKDTSVTTAQRERLHEFNKKYRQYLGETSTIELGKKIKELAGGGDTIECIVRTVVDTPNDVFDTYGRLIGDIILRDASGSEMDINLWLVKEGWAFPTFYASMTTEEISTVLSATADARTRHAGIWKYYSDEIGTFDFGLVFRGKGAEADLENDKGDVIMPKLFRRYTTYSAYKKAGISIAKGDFKSYLGTGRDGCFMTKEFMEQGASASSPYFFYEFIDQMKLVVKPQDLIFIEKPSRLIDAEGNLIKSWT